MDTSNKLGGVVYVFANAFWSLVSFLLAVPDGRDMINNWSLIFWKYLHICNKQYDTKVPNINAVVFSSNW